MRPHTVKQSFLPKFLIKPTRPEIPVISRITNQPSFEIEWKKPGKCKVVVMYGRTTLKYKFKIVNREKQEPWPYFRMAFLVKYSPFSKRSAFTPR